MDYEGEVWKTISIDKNYKVSNFGRFMSLDRKVKCKGGVRTVKGRILKGHVIHSVGYLQVMLSGRKKKLAHRLVAEAFHENHSGKPQVNHKDGNRLNNNASNLEWCTASENILHSSRVLGRKKSYLGKFSSEHCTSKKIKRTCIKSGEVRVYACGMDAARDGFRSCAISRCCNFKIKSHLGFYWEFA